MKSTSHLFKRYPNRNEEGVRKNKRLPIVKALRCCSNWEHGKLIYLVAEGISSIKYCIRKEDIFGVIHDAHMAIGHGGRNWMIKETQTKYKALQQKASCTT